VPQHPLVAALALVACVLVGCATEHAQRSATATAVLSSVPALARAPAKPGELVFHRESSPATHGPLQLDGTYLVRFEQFAPEDPNLDFSGQTPFTATLERRAGDPRGAVKLFQSARSGGRRELRIHGRYVLDVSFGDFPYAVRFTPRP
jgi:hypothetical protein